MNVSKREGYEDGLIEGMEQGAFRQLVSLVQDGLLTCEQAAACSGLSVEEFEKKCKACIPLN